MYAYCAHNVTLYAPVDEKPQWTDRRSVQENQDVIHEFLYISTGVDSIYVSRIIFYFDHCDSNTFRKFLSFASYDSILLGCSE